MDASLWTDLLICDYNHVFDPVVYLKRFFDEEEHDYVFLIDEAHNLGDRVRDMYSCTLQKSDFLAFKRRLKKKNRLENALKRTAQAVNQYLLDIRKRLDKQRQEIRKELDEEFLVLIRRFMKTMEEWMALSENRAHPDFEAMLELYFTVSGFIGISELYDERYTTILEVTYKQDVHFTLFCLNPSEVIHKRLKLARSSTLFSATLTPLPYYREVLGGGETDRMLSLPSPFEQERLLLAAHGGISTKYLNREESYHPIAQTIYTATSCKQGNYLVYFPSYDYMQKVYEPFIQNYPDVPTLIQESRMEEDARADFISRFDEDTHETLVGFCVLGGIFSEGIDLKGNRLIGSIIVGVGLPGISLRQNLIKEYYTGINGRGFDYAYVFPGMNKVLQAAGRVIRSEEDFGFVLLVDSRFHTRAYQELYPPHWNHMNYLRSNDEICMLLQDFPYFK